MKPLPKILVLTDGYVNSYSTIGSVLEIVLGQISECYEITVVSLQDQNTNQVDVSNFYSVKFIKPRENYRGVRRLSVVGERMSRLDVRQFVRMIRKEFQLEEFDYIVFSLQSQTSIRIAYNLLKTHTKKIVVFLWDDIAWWKYECQLDEEASEEIDGLMSEILKKANYVIVPSENMKFVIGNRVENFENILVYRPNFESSDLPLRAERAGQLNSIRIGFSGHGYALNQIETMSMAIRIVKEKRPSIAVDFRIFSRDEFASVRLNATHMGYLSRSDLHQQLVECDLLFLPYPLEEEWSEFVDSSWPSKLSNYAAVGRPFIYLGSRSTAVAKSLEKMDYRFIFDNDSAPLLAHAMLRFVDDEFLRQELLDSVRKFYSSFYNPVTSRAVIQEVFDCNSSQKEVLPKYRAKLISGSVYSLYFFRFTLLPYIRFKSLILLPKRLARKTFLSILQRTFVQPDHNRDK